MGNPYPVNITDSEGEARLSGLAVFTDPGNQPGGGSQPGALIAHRIPFAFNTAGLAAGVGLYVPTVGDLLLDVWLEITTAWDGTTPLGDVGCLAGGATAGLFKKIAGQAVPMTGADHTANQQTNLLQGNNLNSLRLVEAVVQGTSEYNGLYAVAGAAVNLDATAVADGSRLLPAKFVTTDPISVFVSQDGTAGGAAPGGTHGTAALCLVTSTPIAT